MNQWPDLWNVTIATKTGEIEFDNLFKVMFKKEVY